MLSLILCNALCSNAQLLYSCNFDNPAESDRCFEPQLTVASYIGQASTTAPIAPLSDVTSISKPTNNGQLCSLPYQVSPFIWDMHFCNRGYCPTEDGTNSSCQPGRFGYVRLDDSSKVVYKVEINSDGVALGDHCLVYYYYISPAGWKNVTVIKEERNAGNSTIGHVATNPFNGWVPHAISFIVEAAGYAIYFEIEKSPIGAVLVAFDEISIYEGNCDEQPELQSTTKRSTTQTATESFETQTTTVRVTTRGPTVSTTLGPTRSTTRGPTVSTTLGPTVSTTQSPTESTTFSPGSIPTASVGTTTISKPTNNATESHSTEGSKPSFVSTVFGASHTTKIFFLILFLLTKKITDEI